MGYHGSSVIHSPDELQNMRIVSLILVAMLTWLTGCVSVYKIDTQQGNVVTQEMVDKLKPGMTRGQVRFVLGTPLIVDPFHQDRWDYFYYFKKGRELVGQARRLTVMFKNDLLVGVNGDLVIKQRVIAEDTAPPDPTPADEQPLADDRFPRTDTGDTDSSMHGAVTRSENRAL
jgi:outer membrane protein assembly factor BamE